MGVYKNKNRMITGFNRNTVFVTIHSVLVTRTHPDPPHNYPMDWKLTTCKDRGKSLEHTSVFFVHIIYVCFRTYGNLKSKNIHIDFRKFGSMYKKYIKLRSQNIKNH